MSYKERTDNFRGPMSPPGARPLCPDDAGRAIPCDYCGFRYEIEKLVKDEDGLWACPTDLFDPEPKMPEIQEEEYIEPD